MTLANELKSVTRIEIEPPEQPGDSPAPSRRVVIDSAPTIRKILSTLQFEISGKRAIQGCKVPPGFRVRFVTNKGSYEADVTVSAHKHLVVKGGNDGETVHYKLPARFEKIMHSYLRESLGLPG